MIICQGEIEIGRDRKRGGRNTHREREYMLKSVLPNVYSAPTGHHETNQFSAQDDVDDELNDAISEGEGSEKARLSPGQVQLGRI